MPSRGGAEWREIEPQGGIAETIEQAFADREAEIRRDERARCAAELPGRYRGTRRMAWWHAHPVACEFSMGILIYGFLLGVAFLIGVAMANGAP